MLNVELIPFVGFTVDEITPQDKYEDLNKNKTHYHLNSQTMEINFEPIKNYKELRDDKTFQEARKHLRRKELISVKKYDQLCEKIANNMSLHMDNLDKNQRFIQEMKQIADNAYRKKGAFDKTQ